MNHLDDIFNGVLDGDLTAVSAHVQEAVDAGVSPVRILQEGLIEAMDEVGTLFEEGEYFVPEMLIAARAMKAGLAILKPLLVSANVEPAVKVVLGTVQGDMHDIGKNLVAIMLEGAGFEIVDLGTDVAPETFIAAVENEQKNVDLIGLSALLTTTLASLEDTLLAIEQAGLRSRVKIIIGGAPVTAEYADQIGADGFAPDASQAVTVAKALLTN
ncbi:MAG: corrinoid protein [Ardenticatenaceae bacterium]|nr:corrinoid protein [Ardenticatenaceae bacterium]